MTRAPLALICSMVLLAAAPALQGATSGCSDARARQFDFWIGD